MGRKVPIGSLVIDPLLSSLRDHIDQDAVSRYQDMYEAGSTKAIIVQVGTLRIIDGHHRLEAAQRAGLTEVWIEERDADEKDLIAEVFKANRAHGVPLTQAERNKLIRRLYFSSGYTQAQICQLVGLTQATISTIFSRCNPPSVDERAGDGESGSPTEGGNVDNIRSHNADKRVRLSDTQMPAVARLLLAGERQADVAERFGVSQPRVAERWAEFRDRVRQLYVEQAMTKKEVAAAIGLDVGEVDAILQQYDLEPVNFIPDSGSLWTGFKIDDRFGQRHPGNLPADLVRNLLHFYTRPGDVILDPFCGGGVTLDVAADMVGRVAYGFDIDPKRPDIAKWDITAGPPPCPQQPAVIFLDPPYGPMKAGEYSAHPNELADMEVSQFLEMMARIFTYWQKGRLILVMGCLRKDGVFTALPFECAKRLEAAGWVATDWLANQVNRPASEGGITVSMERKHRIPLRSHVDVIVCTRS